MEKRLYRHKLLHNDKQWVCDVGHCTHTYTTYASLKRHQKRVHSTGTYWCHHRGCKYKTGYDWHLTRHLLSHSKELISQCDYTGCGKKFNRKQYLRAHELRKHPDLCPDVRWIHCKHMGCKYRTKYKADLLKHSVKHPGNCNIDPSVCPSNQTVTPITAVNEVVNVNHESIDGNINEFNANCNNNNDTIDTNSDIKLKIDLLDIKAKTENTGNLF